MLDIYVNLCMVKLTTKELTKLTVGSGWDILIEFKAATWQFLGWAGREGRESVWWLNNFRRSI